MKTIIKRDGREKKFQEIRIREAIEKAYLEKYNNLKNHFDEIDGLVDNIVSIILLKDKETFTVEEIQDIVIDELNKVNNKVSKAYQDYRQKRTKERESKAQVFNKIQDIMENKSEDARDNANKAGDKIQSIRAMVADSACREYNHNRLIPKNLLNEHKKRIYIHDDIYFGLPFFNCFLINWTDMLEHGFHVDNTYVRQPNSLRTAVTILSQLVARCSSNCYGGVTLSDLCVGLEPYAIKSYNKHLKIASEEGILDKEGYAWRRLEKEAYDSFQDLLYSINCLCTSRSEVPFVTISYGLGTSTISRLIQKSILKVRMDGFEGGVTPVFPKEIFILKKGLNLNPTDPNYDIFKLAVECSAHRIYPDYISFDKVIEATGDYKTCMSCRSFLSTYKDENGNIITQGRFNQGVMSINLVRLALLANGDENEFYKQLDECLELCRQGLMFRHNVLRTVKANQSPILYMEGAVARLNADDSIIPLLENNYSSLSIGYVGVSNTIKALYDVDYKPTNQFAIDKAKQIMQYIRDYCDNLKRATGLGFSLYSTPFETGATKLCKQDIKDFGIIEGVNSKGYYENSFHFDSDKDITPFDKIDFESNFTNIASGGAIQYTEYPSMINNLEALEDTIRYAYDKVHYYGINVKPDICLACGHSGEMISVNESENDYKCPNCGNKDKSLMSVVRRVCGYTTELSLRKTVDNKMKEINHRKNHFKA